MTASNVAATQAVAYAFLDKNFPWVPKPAVIEYDNTAGGSRYFATAKTISVPKYSDAWNDGREDVVIHECGHVVIFNAAGDVTADFLKAIGGDPGLRDHPQAQEILAEHFARAYVVGYRGANYPLLVGLVPFDEAKTRAFFQSLHAGTAAAVGNIPSAPAPAPTALAVEAIGPVPSSNFMSGRDGNPVTLIVDHWMATTLAGADSRFKNPAERVSAHYGVTQDGRIVQWVSEDNTAYHAGNWTKNLLSIGIEHEASPTMPPTDAMYAASARLHADIAARHNITLAVGATVLPHNAITATACPGTLDLDRIVREAGLEEEMDRDTFNAWFLEEYKKVGAGAKFDELATQIGGKAEKAHPHTANTTVS